ncbi:MAG TPA: TolC family protein [Polyangiaceae bacterium]|jgi:outer membrane protein TolC|nr:TolC family protein [Polyangiaceae bacterium]
MARLRASLCAFALLAFANPVLAQQPQPHQTQPQVLPLSTAEGVNLPPPPVVDDPDLKPLPPAKRVVSSWDEIAAYLRARSPDLRIALDEVGRAEAQRRVALAGILGTLTASGTYTHNFLTTNGLVFTTSGSQNVAQPFPDYVTGGITATLPLIAPRQWNAIKMADVNIGINKASLDDVRRVLSTNVANAALTVVTNERVAELNRVGLRQALERLELAKRKTSLGAGTGLDVIRAQQDVENARSTLVSGDETARQAREAFGIAIGVAEDVSVAGDLSFEAITRQVLSMCKPAPSIEDRADIIAARERVHFARVNTWDIKTQFFPTLGLQSALGTTSIFYINPATTWNFQAVLSWNIWDGGARYGNLRDANLQVLEAQDRLDSARRTAVIQVVQADRGVSVAQNTRDVASRSRDLAAEVDRLTRAGFMTGTGTSLDLVTAAAALRQAEINLALSDYGVIKSKILAVLALATCPL